MNKTLSIIIPITIVLILNLFAANAQVLSDPKDIVGHWEGWLQATKSKLEIKTDFRAVNDNLVGTIDIPTQMVKRAPLTKITSHAGKIHFELTLGGTNVAFDGIIVANKISGNYKQDDFKGAFELVSKPAPEESGYTSILDTPTGKLYGTLELPDKGEVFPVVLLIAGSGPTDRDGNNRMVPGNCDNLKMISDSLVKRGYAVLRYDKRGIGESMSAMQSEFDVIFDDYVNDAANWIAKLRADSRFSKVAVLGHSEGALIAMLAAQKANVDAALLVSGTARSLDEIMIDQMNTNAPPEIIEEAKHIIKELKAGRKVDSVGPEILILFRPSIQPFMMSIFKVVPTVEIVKLKIPTMIIQGKHDLQVPTEEAEMLAKAKPDAKKVLVESMNHVLKIAPSDPESNFQAYADPNLPLAQGFVDAVSKFLDENMKKKKK
ncbi:MAG: hypothetical protein HW421_3714 [Ignavibacteria bacterium]|nr:hypothetical protein [Ignavibacteria bacterium]